MSLNLQINCDNNLSGEDILKLLVRTADCEPWLDCDNASDSWLSILKRLVSDAGDGLLALNVCCGLTQLTPSAEPPAGATAGAIYFDTDGHFYGFNGTDWKQLDN